MSDSELSDALSTSLPPDFEIEATLKKEAKKAAEGPEEDYTVSKIRKSTENILNLPAGFFKGDETWKSRSKAVIDEQVANEDVSDSPEPESQHQPSGVKSKSKPTKRAPPKEKPQARKKQKLDSDDNTSALSSPPSDSEPDYEEEIKPQKGNKDKKKPVSSQPKSKPKPKPKPKSASIPKSKAKTKTEDSDSEAGSDKEDSENVEDDKNDSGSELSVVLDEAPAKKQRSKSKSVDNTNKSSKTSKSKPSTEPDPDQEEIKKLQGWLVKCGIRKVWGKELKPFPTSKAKIKHLKEMLSDAGMSGRYSNDKAAQIKEARELAADIEAVQEGNERWGKSGEEDNADGDDDLKTRGGRRLVRGAKNYDFLSSDGEETD